MKPTARRDGLVIEDVEGEVVVYDRVRHRAHHLNRAAALVWHYCNGRNTVADLANRLRSETGVAVREKLVWRALGQLGKARLLREPVVCPASTKAVTRRQALRRLGRTAAAVVVAPLVTSVVAPALLYAKGPPKPLQCQHPPCTSVCANQCTNGFTDCGKGFNCVTKECQDPRCVGCKQRRCVSNGSPTRPK
jgi:hypothetical protein